MDLIERRAGGARHPWEIARAAFVRRALASTGILASTRRLLDVGSGDAWLAQQLRRELPTRAEIVCWDANYTAEDQRALAGEHPDIAFVSARPSGRFDVLLLLDVLEHVDDDAAFLSRTVMDLATSGAYALVTVPAWQSLFSQRDRHLAHYRRYSFGSARALLRTSGLRVIADGGLFHSLLPMRAASVLAERLRGARDGAGVNPVAWDRGPALTSALAGMLGAEARASLLLGRLGVPLPGLSYWAICGSRV